MTVKTAFKNLLTVILFTLTFTTTSLFSFNINANENNPAPKATPKETEISFWDLPLLKNAYIETAPAINNDHLIAGKLGLHGVDKTKILQLAQELADNKHGDYDSLLIAHKGKFVFESYYKRGRVNLPHFQSSATKGVTSLIIARAIQLGYLSMSDLNKPLVSFLKGLDSTKFVDGVEKITLHQAMTMRSGLGFSDEEMKKFRESPKQFKGVAQVQAFFELSEPVTSQSQAYKYRGYDPIMVMHVLDAVVPSSAKDFINNEFFDKLGINNYRWRNDANNMPRGENGLSMTSRDMLKLGTLVLNGGKWNGEQLLSADYLAKATSAITQPTEDWQPKNFSYGYLWYQTSINVNDKVYEAKLTWGGGGNRIIIIEEIDLVVVFTGYDQEDKIFSQVEKVILPAFIKR